MPTRSGKDYAVSEFWKDSECAKPSPAVVSGPPKRSTKSRLAWSSAKPDPQPSNKRQKKSIASTTAPARLAPHSPNQRECAQPAPLEATTTNHTSNARAPEAHSRTQKKMEHARESDEQASSGQARSRQIRLPWTESIHKISDHESTKAFRRSDSNSNSFEGQISHFLDLTQDSDPGSIECVPSSKCQPRHGGDDESESDSRYIQGRRKPGQSKRSVRSAPQLSEELPVQEQEQDIQPEVCISHNTGSAHLQAPTVQDDRHDFLHDIGADHQKQTEKEAKAPIKHWRKDRKKGGKRSHALESEKVERGSIMFTAAEAIAALAQVRDDPKSIPAITYDLPTGSSLNYPVQRSYHLGAMGRYKAAVVESSPHKYIFDWGAYSGKRITEVPQDYIEQILASPRLEQLLEQRLGLRGALNSRKPGDTRLKSRRIPLPSSLGNTLRHAAGPSKTAAP
ncbi:Nn.00g103700.m01.CDS01 [Neocucurbitaria sp. VM-36]